MAGQLAQGLPAGRYQEDGGVVFLHQHLKTVRSSGKNRPAKRSVASAASDMGMLLADGTGESGIREGLGGA